jgi:hypothetical protein
VALDPWTTPYRLTYGEQKTFRVTSAGADKKFNTKDDIHGGDL